LKKTILLYFLFQFILFSCASSPVSPGRESPSVFSFVESVVPQWQKFTNGIDYFHGKISSPKLEFHVLRIDLTSPDIKIVVRGGGQDSSGRLTLSTKVSSFVRSNSLIAGINAVPFDFVSSKEKQPIQNAGIVISDGELISPANQRYDALVFYKFEDSNQSGDSRKVAIVRQSEINSIENIQNAVGGFSQILLNGEPAQRTLNREARHPRSAAGLSTNSGYLYLLVIDGKRSGSLGATERETALLLRSLGSEDGINFDGGGSSALALRYPNGKVRVVNTPVHGRVPGRERAVAGCIGVSMNN